VDGDTLPSSGLGLGRDIESVDLPASLGPTVLSLPPANTCHMVPHYLGVIQLEREKNSIAVLGLAIC
jgi:hypothetical protein